MGGGRGPWGCSATLRAGHPRCQEAGACFRFRTAPPTSPPGVEWDLTGLPVPAQPLVYTTDEWAGLQQEGGRFADVLREETVWVWEREDRRAQ